MVQQQLLVDARQCKCYPHPIQYAAAVLFSDGTIETSCMQQAMEYGNTLDAVSLLASHLLSRRQAAVTPTLLLHVDNFGILHAPFAVARSFLTEREFDVPMVVMDGSCMLHRCTTKQFVPNNPDIDFGCSTHSCS